MQNSVIDIGNNRSGSRPTSTVIPKIIVTPDDTEVQEIKKQEPQTYIWGSIPIFSLGEIIIGLTLVSTFIFLKNYFYVLQQNV